MCRDAPRRKSGQALFRQSAVNAAGHRLFGGVAVVVPPSGKLALAIAVLAVSALTAVTTVVEVPQRSRAVGVLMPVGGLRDMVATRSGQVGNVFVSEGQLVEKGQLLLTITDGAYLRGESAPEANLRSLRSELELLHEAHARQQEISADSLTALQEQMSTAQTQLEIARARFQSHGNELAILEKRFLRWQELVGGGHVSRDAFELEHANLIRARADHAELQQKNVDHAQVIQTLSRSQTKIQKQLGLNRIQHALSAERLQRSIELGRHEARQELSSSEPSVVAQVLVRPGDAVRSGQVLAKLRRPGERLQAWLYLSTSSARLLRAGQSVEISLDAYPQQVYGTQTAVVSSVSGIALLPKDVRAPLLVAGPVFEVRAELNENSVSVNGVNWPLSPGISFSADIIQRRLKLYEWVLQSLLGDAGDADS